MFTSINVFTFTEVSSSIVFVHVQDYLIYAKVLIITVVISSTLLYVVNTVICINVLLQIIDVCKHVLCQYVQCSDMYQFIDLYKYTDLY